MLCFSRAVVDNHLENVIEAFNRDGWSVNRKDDVWMLDNGLGVRAHNKTATIGETGKKKLAYYVQGDWKVAV